MMPTFLICTPDWSKFQRKQLNALPHHSIIFLQIHVSVFFVTAGSALACSAVSLGDASAYEWLESGNSKHGNIFQDMFELLTVRWADASSTSDRDPRLPCTWDGASGRCVQFLSLRPKARQYKSLTWWTHSSIFMTLCTGALKCQRICHCIFYQWCCGNLRRKAWNALTTER